jgi:hypothetical protein
MFTVTVKDNFLEIYNISNISAYNSDFKQNNISVFSIYNFDETVFIKGTIFIPNGNTFKYMNSRSILCTSCFSIYFVLGRRLFDVVYVLWYCNSPY